MARTVRAALVQTAWTGDKETMIKAHEEYARRTADQGAQVICFQELFSGPYFCQVQDPAFYAYAESVPGPTTERFQALAAELGLVMVLQCPRRSAPASSTTPPAWSMLTAPTTGSVERPTSRTCTGS